MELYPGDEAVEDGTRYDYPLSPLGYGLVGSLAGVVIIALIGGVSYGIGIAVHAMASLIV